MDKNPRAFDASLIPDAHLRLPSLDGVVADWDTLPSALSASLPSFRASRVKRDSDSVGAWSLMLGRTGFELTIDVLSSFAIDWKQHFHPTNFGGVASENPLGDAMAEIGMDPSLRGRQSMGFHWVYRNVVVDLRCLGVDDVRKELRSIGEAVQLFLVRHRVENLTTHIPEVTFEPQLPKRVALGSKLVVSIRTAHVDEQDLSVVGEPESPETFVNAGTRELSFTPPRAGTFAVGVRVKNRRTLLTSSSREEIQVVSSIDREPSTTVSIPLQDIAVEDGASPHLVSAPSGKYAFRVHVVPLGPTRFLLMQYRTLVASAAPPDLVTELVSVFQVDPPAKPRRLAPEPFQPGPGHLRFNRTGGQLALGGRDWVYSIDASPAAREQGLALLKAAGIGAPEVVS